jgi:Ni/Fe-hydrogenase subunit HybB-like protein
MAEFILVTVEYLIRRRRKFKLVFWLDTTFNLVFWLDTTLKLLVNSQMLLNAAVVHDRVICEPPETDDDLYSHTG